MEGKNNKRARLSMDGTCDGEEGNSSKLSPEEASKVLDQAHALLNRLKQGNVQPGSLDPEKLREASFLLDVIHYEQNIPQIPEQVHLPTGETLVARTWPELLRLLELNSWESHTGKYSSPFLFRGLPNADFKMVTSLQRLGHEIGSAKERRVERGILRSFINYCHGSLDSSASLFEWLTLAQHHGCPTRILDFTLSPLIALHFACRDPSKDSSDGIVWCVDPRKCLEASDTYKALHQEWRKSTNDDYWHVCRTSQMLSLIDFAHSKHQETNGSTPSAFDRGASQKISMLDKLGVLGDSLVFMEAPSMHQRVVNQNHVFAFLTGKTQSIDDWLEARVAHNIYRKIIISKSLKMEVRQRLHDMGITERLLFPGLTGTSKWLKNYYTPTSSDSVLHDDEPYE